MSKEDIEILKEKIEFWKNDPRIMIQEENYKILQVIENILLERQADKERIKELEKENKELLELRISASAHNRIMELEKENQSYRDYYGTPPCYDNSKYIPVSLVEEKIEYYKELQNNYIKKYDEVNDGLQAMINVLQELLEKRK